MNQNYDTKSDHLSLIAPFQLIFLRSYFVILLEKFKGQFFSRHICCYSCFITGHASVNFKIKNHQK